ncbi:hypothetical protein TNCV_4431781 [Trichonephila clavipes]|nr:hypothetical protein TNCV_4431781 [Trichonephila clavipes]
MKTVAFENQPVIAAALWSYSQTSPWRGVRSSLVSLKTRHVEEFKVLPLVWCENLERGVPTQLTVSSLERGSK